jgi:hypothetical protein
MVSLPLPFTGNAGLMYDIRCPIERGAAPVFWMLGHLLSVNNAKNPCAQYFFLSFSFFSFFFFFWSYGLEFYGESFLGQQGSNWFHLCVKIIVLLCITREIPRKWVFQMYIKWFPNWGRTNAFLTHAIYEHYAANTRVHFFHPRCNNKAMSVMVYYTSPGVRIFHS